MMKYQLLNTSNQCIMKKNIIISYYSNFIYSIVGASRKIW